MLVAAAEVKWVLLDAVGTLIYPRPPVAHAYLNAGRKFGSKLSLEEVADRFATAFKEVFGNRGLATDAGQERDRWRAVVFSVFDDVEHRELLFDLLWDHFAKSDNWQVEHRVGEVLEFCRSRGWSVGIASNFDARLEQLVENLPPLDTVDAVLFSESLGWNKPAPQFYEQIFERLQIEAKSVLMVGDSRENDVETPRRLGCQAIHIDSSGNSSDSVPHIGMIGSVIS